MASKIINTRQLHKTFSNPNFLAFGIIAVVISAVVFANRGLYSGAQDVVAAHTFTDVDPSNVFWESVEKAHALGVMEGFACGGPSEPCDLENRPYARWGQPYTRAALLIALEKVRVTDKNNIQQIYADVPVTDAGASAAGLIAKDSILISYPCGGPGEPCDSQNLPYLRPDQGINRAEIASVVYDLNAASHPLVKQAAQAPTESFEDVPASSPYWQQIEYVHATGVLNGYACGTSDKLLCIAPKNKPYYQPTVVLTRGQAARVIVDAIALSQSPATK